MKVLILYACSNKENFDLVQEVVSKLVAAGGDAEHVHTKYVGDCTPTLSDLLPYDAVLVENFRGQFHSGSDLGDLLADYVDAGKGLVLVGTCNYEGKSNTSNSSVGGRFKAEGYHPLTYGRLGGGQGTQAHGMSVVSPSNNSLTGTRKAGKVHLPDHPIMEGVVSQLGGVVHVYVDCQLQGPDAVCVAEFDNGLPFIAFKPGSRNSKVVAVNSYAATDKTHSLSNNIGNSGVMWLNCLKYSVSSGQ